MPVARRALLILLCAVPALAQLPTFYKRVDRVTWVVADASRVAGEWSRLASIKILDRGEIEIPDAQFRGRPTGVKVRYVEAKFRDVRLLWIQPLGGDNAYTDFLRRHGDGVFSLVHRVPSREALEQELERLRGLGAGVLQRERVKGAEYAYLDTRESGQYVLGLVYLPTAPEDEPPPPPLARINQFAFVTREPKAVSAYWEKLGFPPLACNSGTLRDIRYRGQNGQFAMDLCWQRQGAAAYEWIVPTKGPNIYEEHVKAHGDGPQHFGFPVEEMDPAIAEWRKAGFPLSQSGAWGEEGKRGLGRFAYVDAPAGGMSVELLWNFR
jgi:hypothetical protein